MQVQANMESHQAESNRRGMNLKYWFMKMEHIYTSATKHGTISSWKHCMPYMFKVILTNHRLNMSRTYKNNTEASRIEQILKTRDLTSSKLCKLSQTLVPLISDTCRSEVSPPKITKTFCLDVPLWIASACFDDCNFLDKAVHALLHGTREGNREQAC